MQADSMREVSCWGEQDGKVNGYKYLGTGEDLDYIRQQYPAIASIFLNQEGPIAYIVQLLSGTNEQDRPPEYINGIYVLMSGVESPI